MFMKRFVLNSAKGQKGDTIKVEPFRLQKESEIEPSEFEVIFLFNNEMYRYGFEVTQSSVVAEWLYHRPKTREIELFYRTGQDFRIHEKGFSKGMTVFKEKLIRENALMVSVAAQFNDEVAGTIIDWFRNLKVISGLHEEGYMGLTIEKAMNPDYKKKMVKLLKAADLGIQDIQIQPINIDDLSNEEQRVFKKFKQIAEKENPQLIQIVTSHRCYDKNDAYTGAVSFSMGESES